MENPKFDLFKSSGQFYFHLKAENGKNILYSEGYATKQGAENGVKSVKENAPFDARYVRKDALTYTFVLTASNGHTIGRSESYTAAAACENGIAAVKRCAPISDINDLT
ncbi:YegP family protein [Chitinophaga sp.]|uniref:YegP family protein n=1 Tax=Chitinophaga sp. TaxID=1869181 RepID=UPI0031DCCA57